MLFFFYILLKIFKKEYPMNCPKRKLHEVHSYQETFKPGEYTNARPKVMREIFQKVKEGDSACAWDANIFNEFWGNGKVVASLGNGMISNEDKEEVQKHWDDSGLKDALHLLTLEPEKLQWDVYEKIDEILQKLTTKHYILATVRLIATLQPRLFSMTVNPKSLDDIVANFKQDGIDFDYEGYERVSSKDEVLETLRRSHLIQTLLIQEYQDDFIYDLGDVTGALANLNKN